jgi:hypothetical protein
MSPRRNRPRRDEVAIDEEKARRAIASIHPGRAGNWFVRTIPGDPDGKVYRCPGCQQEITAGTPHVVAWLAETGDASDRRHWHTSCFRARDRRGPSGRR